MGFFDPNLLPRSGRRPPTTRSYINRLCSGVASRARSSINLNAPNASDLGGAEIRFGARKIAEAPANTLRGIARPPSYVLGRA